MAFRHNSGILKSGRIPVLKEKYRKLFKAFFVLTPEWWNIDLVTGAVAATKGSSVVNNDEFITTGSGGTAADTLKFKFNYPSTNTTERLSNDYILVAGLPNNVSTVVDTSSSCTAQCIYALDTINTSNDGRLYICADRLVWRITADGTYDTGALPVQSNNTNFNSVAFQVISDSFLRFAINGDDFTSYISTSPSANSPTPLAYYNTNTVTALTGTPITDKTFNLQYIGYADTTGFSSSDTELLTRLSLGLPELLEPSISRPFFFISDIPATVGSGVIHSTTMTPPEGYGYVPPVVTAEPNMAISLSILKPTGYAYTSSALATVSAIDSAQLLAPTATTGILAKAALTTTSLIAPTGFYPNVIVDMEQIWLTSQAPLGKALAESGVAFASMTLVPPEASAGSINQVISGPLNWFTIDAPNSMDNWFDIFACSLDSSKVFMVSQSYSHSINDGDPEENDILGSLWYSDTGGATWREMDYPPAIPVTGMGTVQYAEADAVSTNAAGDKVAVSFWANDNYNTSLNTYPLQRSMVVYWTRVDWPYIVLADSDPDNTGFESYGRVRLFDVGVNTYVVFGKMIATDDAYRWTLKFGILGGTLTETYEIPVYGTITGNKEWVALCSIHPVVNADGSFFFYVHMQYQINSGGKLTRSQFYFKYLKDEDNWEQVWYDVENINLDNIFDVTVDVNSDGTKIAIASTYADELFISTDSGVSFAQKTVSSYTGERTLVMIDEQQPYVLINAQRFSSNNGDTWSNPAFPYTPWEWANSYHGVYYVRRKNIHDKLYKAIVRDVTATAQGFAHTTMYLPTLRIIVNDIRTPPIEYQYALVYDIILKRWGKLKVNHIDVVELNNSILTNAEPKNDMGFLKIDGSMQAVDHHISADASDAALILGKFNIDRSHMTSITEIILSNIASAVSDFELAVGTTLNGYDIQLPVITPTEIAAGAQNRRFLVRSVGQSHVLILTGTFNLVTGEVMLNDAGRR